MKIRKIASAILMANMVLSLAACGSTGTSSSTVPEKSTDSQSKSTTASSSGNSTIWDQPAEFDKALSTMDLSNVVAGVETAHLTMSTHCSETDSNYLYALSFQKAVEELSGGAMKVDVYANGQLFGQADALQAIQQGTLDIANSDTALLANYNKAAGILDIPFLMKNRDQAIKCVKDEEITNYINDMIEPSDMHLLSVLPLNFRNALVKDMNISSVADFKGFIMRVPEAPHTIAAFEAIGATPTVIPSGEAYTAVQTGVADGLEGHAEYMVLQKFYEVAKNYVQTQHVFTFTDYVMSKKVYDGLTDKQRQVIDEAAKQAQSVHIAYTANLYPAMYKELESFGVKITEIDTKPFIEATEEYRNNYIQENNLQSLVDKINAYE
ncbi:MAG: TRAP transporter substrate-binding protein [Lawsonibacter sp.]|nr:TRAP transporter substrate-binding protein [Lawsonibacter sp.]